MLKVFKTNMSNGEWEDQEELAIDQVVIRRHFRDFSDPIYANRTYEVVNRLTIYHIANHFGASDFCSHEWNTLLVFYTF